MSYQKKSPLQIWKQWVYTIKREVYTLYVAYRDSRTPWYSKVFTALVVAYAFSPIDLIPDFIPILGYVDDMVLIPIGVVIALRISPPEVIIDARAKAEEVLSTGKPVSWGGAVVIGIIWIALAALVIRLLTDF